MADFTSNTGEGRLISATNAVFATVRGAASANSNDTFPEVACSLNGGNYGIQRFFMPIDTTTLPLAATVVSAVLKLYREDSNDTFTNTDTTTLELVPETQASNTALANSDYSALTFSSFGSLALSATTNHVYNSITLTDLTKVIAGGHTKIGLLLGRDQGNSAPTGVNQMAFQRRSDANPPTLTVTFTLPGGTTNYAIFV